MPKSIVSILAIFSVLPTMAIANVTVSGLVTDEEGEPFPGAAIKVVGTTKGVSADMDGFFTIENLSENQKIEISVLGYEPQTIPATAGQNLKITLLPKDTAIKEAIISAKAPKDCEPRKNEKEVVKDPQTQKCYVVSCISDRYKLINEQTAYRNQKLISFNTS